MLIIDNLIQRIDEKTCPIIVGLDPFIQLIPSHIKRRSRNEFGNSQRAAAESLYLFNKEIIETLDSLIPAVKLQMACYELYGAFGMEAFRKTLHLAKEHDLIVIDDSKRNDIGSSSELYAIGHLGHPPLIEGEDSSDQPDFLTVNPLFGSDSIDPFVKVCRNHNKGIFILARTSNPSAKEYLEARLGKVFLYERIALDIEKRARLYLGDRGYSPLGAVVGATWAEETEKLRVLAPSTYFLVPGYGAQGGTADRILPAFDRNGYGALVNSSRDILFAYRNKQFRERYGNGRQFAEASKKALLLMKEEILQSLKRAKKLPRNW